MLSASLVKTPVGQLILAEENGELVVCCTKEYYPSAAKRVGLPTMDLLLKSAKTPALRSLELKLKKYFSGDLKALVDTERKVVGSSFQEAVWKSLTRIKAGDVKSYGEIAESVKSPGAARAVGTACGSNPFLLFVPCHRVIASNGRLGGFSSGIKKKVHLLAHEGIGRKCSCCQ